jgi:Raf kinase inhibitor-like YbhB/YbcL family protein
MLLTSPAIPPGGPIPAQYTCDGRDISPPLAWSELPAGTRSLVLVVEDPDAPGGTFRHWAAFDIPPTTSGLAAGYRAGAPASGFVQAENDFGKTGYGGPCPPPGAGPHHYVFRLLALSRPRLDLAGSPSALAVLQAAQPYAIGRAELVGTYGR